MPTVGISRSFAVAPGEWAALCREADAAGIDRAWAADTAPNDAIVDAALALTATTRMQVSISVALPVRSALETAYAVQELANYAPGRFTIGLGPGNAGSLATHGVPFDPPLTRLREYFEALSSLLRSPAGTPIDYSGRFIRAKGTAFGLDIPFVFGSFGERAVRFAAEVGDGIVFHLQTPRTVLVERAALARSVGRPLFLAAGLPMSIHPDERVALRRARAELAAALMLPHIRPRLLAQAGREAAEEYATLLAAGRLPDAAAALPENTVRAFITVTTPDGFAEAIRAYDFLDHLIPLPVGMFWPYAGPVFGLTAEDAAESRRVLLDAMYQNVR